MKGIGQILYDIERRVIIFKSLDNNVRTLGTIHTVYPENIRFLDDPFLNYIFPGKEEKE